MDVGGAAGFGLIGLDNLLGAQGAVRVIKDGDVSGELANYVKMLSCFVKKEVTGAEICRKAGRRAVIGNAACKVYLAYRVCAELAE